MKNADMEASPLEKRPSPASTSRSIRPSSSCAQSRSSGSLCFYRPRACYARACSWPSTQWAVHLLLLLSRETQLAVQQLPAENLLAYADLKKAILQWVSQTPEQQRQCFRSLTLGEHGRPFASAQQLWDACQRWLLAEQHNVGAVIDLMVLEQFIARLPRVTAECVQCHHLASLQTAIQLAEDHMAVYSGDPLFSLSPVSPHSLSSPLVLYLLPGNGEFPLPNRLPSFMDCTTCWFPLSLSALTPRSVNPLLRAWAGSLGQFAGAAGSPGIYRTNAR
ncbi:uncharacterized protein LOC127436589 [Myxocyprinus asiaticus]|uniref:uncharacterized protein LOC127436589 n=1 Tax=Myxocyprinus asiaticus TaxID=70543 RepID=UPI002221744D|nr:uncharacterized protein LOC127436589 [Myxocyprinus asiaticus]